MKQQRSEIKPTENAEMEKTLIPIDKLSAIMEPIIGAALQAKIIEPETTLALRNTVLMIVFNDPQKLMLFFSVNIVFFDANNIKTKVVGNSMMHWKFEESRIIKP